MEYTTVTASEFAALDGMGNWIYRDGTIRAEYTASSFPGAADLAKAVAAAAEEANHHPDLAIRYPGRLEVVLTTHGAGGLTSLDVDLARVVDRLAAAAGATPD
jgi:4a-hydroxytetrahydrobiopterin dehydratase